MKNLLLLAVCLLTIFIANAQNIRGIVFWNTGKGNEPVAGANIVWLGTQEGTSTNAKGEFEVNSENINDKKLVVSYVGFVSDTIDVESRSYLTITLKDIKTLHEVTVESERADVYISSIQPIKTEIITQKELAKGACCDLAGCFNTNASVQPTTTNIVTNAQELRILGLSGVYNQVLVDGLPLIQGLSYTYGISSIPGTLVDNIYVSKGANSVLQGFESMSGQINVELKEPGKNGTDEKVLLNAYMNSFFEKQLNLNFSGRWKKWSSISAFQTVQPASRFDKDGDSFLDLPLLTRYMIYSKQKFSDPDSIGLSFKTGIKFLTESRTGGQINFDPETERGDTLIYGQSIAIQQPDIYTKTSFRFNKDNAVSLMASAFLHDQNSWFGESNYTAKHQNFYANFQYELKWLETHEVKTGISFRYNTIDERIFFTRNSLNKTYNGNFLKKEQIAGIFSENIFRWIDNKLMLITGIRFDNHPSMNGKMLFTPRGLLKYEIAEGTNIRVSAGKGWRTINLFSENINLLASQRDIIITEKLNPEEAVNYGTNFTHSFEKEIVEGSLTLDFYRTQFQNQIFPDYDTDVSKAFISNLTGTSVSNSFQAEINLKFFEKISLKTAYNFLDVFRKEGADKKILPFNSKHKILSTLSYKPLDGSWHADAVFHWYGKQHLPSTSALPTAFQRPDQSIPYTTVNAQFTKVWKKFEAYFGCENIFDFRQKEPIISWQNPFGPYFDTSSAWGPTRGRELYAGLRLKI